MLPSLPNMSWWSETSRVKPPIFPVTQAACENWRDTRADKLQRTGVPSSGEQWQGARCPVSASA